jgi:hypothetical protein
VDQDPRLSFSRFVTALRCNARAVHRISFYRVNFRATPEEDTARLLGEVLPSHPALESVEFSYCQFSAPQWRLFRSFAPTAAAAAAAATSRAAPPRIVALEFDARPVDREGARAIADLVRRNVPITNLTIRLAGDGTAALDPDACQLICRSVPHNQHLRVLKIPVRELLADTLDGVAASSSPIHDLVVEVGSSITSLALKGLAW